MLTQLGRCLRKIRIDRVELLKDMADRLCMSSSMLSSIENGNRRPPGDFIDRVISAYDLTATETNELKSATMQSMDSVAIDLKNLESSDRELAFSFARRFNDLDLESKESIMEILRKGDH